MEISTSNVKYRIFMCLYDRKLLNDISYAYDVFKYGYR